MPGPIAFLGAMLPEIEALVHAMEGAERAEKGAATVWRGRLFGRDCIVARTGIGKVSAAAAVQLMIDRYEAQLVSVVGLAGGLSDEVRLGDVVIGETLVHHDLDASPIFPRYEVPGLGVARFQVRPDLVRLGVEAAEAFLGGLGQGNRRPRVLTGLIATGDQIILAERRRLLREALPDALCAEMEGAAVAQVCHVNQAPYLIVRTVSDNADENAAQDFQRFLAGPAAAYARGLARELLARLP
jgi:adenosylhomocysteine nucleosidase